MKLVIQLLTVCLLLSSCDTKQEQNLVGTRGQIFKYPDPKSQSDVIELLRQSDIKYMVEDGYVVTSMQDTAEVRKILRHYDRKEQTLPFDIEAIKPASKQYENILIKKFDEADVRYSFQSYHGYRYVTWQIIDAELVDQIVEEVELEMYEAMLNEQNRR